MGKSWKPIYHLNKEDNLTGTRRAALPKGSWYNPSQVWLILFADGAWLSQCGFCALAVHAIPCGKGCMCSSCAAQLEEGAGVAPTGARHWPGDCFKRPLWQLPPALMRSESTGECIFVQYNEVLRDSSLLDKGCIALLFQRLPMRK